MTLKYQSIVVATRFHGLLLQKKVEFKEFKKIKIAQFFEIPLPIKDLVSIICINKAPLGELQHSSWPHWAGDRDAQVIYGEQRKRLGSAKRGYRGQAVAMQRRPPRQVRLYPVFTREGLKPDGLWKVSVCFRCLSLHLSGAFWGHSQL